MISERVLTWLILFIVHGGAMFVFGYAIRYLTGSPRVVYLKPGEERPTSWWSSWWRTHPKGEPEESTGNPD